MLKALGHSVAFAILAASCGTVNAMDIHFCKRFDDPNIQVPKSLCLSGDIEIGDSDKLRSLIREAPAIAKVTLGSVDLASNGGDIREAMKLGTLLKSLYPNIGVSGNCASSCVLLYMAGIGRVVQGEGRIGVHRPYFRPEYFSRLSVNEAKRAYAAMEAEFHDYLIEAGLPQSLYEKLIATPSDSIYWLSNPEIGLIGSNPPYFAERLKSSCSQCMNTSSATFDVNAFGICFGNIVKREQFDAIDHVLGAIKNADYETFKRNQLAHLSDSVGQECKGVRENETAGQGGSVRQVANESEKQALQVITLNCQYSGSQGERGESVVQIDFTHSLVDGGPAMITEGEITWVIAAERGPGAWTSTINRYTGGFRIVKQEPFYTASGQCQRVTQKQF